MESDSPTPRRITLQDLALQAGVHRTTVSRALMGHPGIPPATKKRIRDLARRMGYTPDPALQALTAYRLKQRPPKFHGVIAWLDAYQKPGEASRLFDQHREGAVRRCTELGYRIEDFWLHEPEMSGRRLSQILRQRGIQGILVAPLPQSGWPFTLHWEWFSLVGLSPTITEPKIHLVHNAQFETIREMVRQVADLGYKRPGFVIWSSEDLRSRNAWTAGFLSSARNHALDFPDSVLELSNEVSEHRESILLWLGRARPDVILSHHIELRPLLKEAGIQVPRDIGCAWTEVRIVGNQASGATQREQNVGAAAVDLLHTCMLRGERGIPDHQLRLLVSSSWVAGKTLRQKPARSGSLSRS